MIVDYDGLSSLARAYLGVVAAGLVPASVAGDEGFRLDYVTAVCEALMGDLPASAHLEADGPQPKAAFLDDLRRTIGDLDARGVVIAGAGDSAVMMLPSAGREIDKLTPAQMAQLDLSRPARIVDTFLAYRALDELLGNPRVYSFLMEKYSASSAVWQKLAAPGYGR